MSSGIFVKEKQFVIGNFTLGLQAAFTGGRYPIPFSLDAFSSKIQIPGNELDFKYKISPVQSFVDPEGIPVVEFDSGCRPYQIFERDGEGYIWLKKNKTFDNQLVYKISKDWSEWELLLDKTESSGMESMLALSPIFAYAILPHEGIMFHGVVMEWNGKGIMVCAHSKVGKTTHTRIWRDEENALILNGDRVLCRKNTNGWYAFGSPWSGSSGEYINRCVPITTFVILERAEENVVSLLSPVEGAMELMQLTFAPIWEEQLMSHAFSTIDSIVKQIPILKLSCRPDRNAVIMLRNAIEKL